MSIENTEIDRLHCLAIVHEYHRCRDSFELFTSVANRILLGGNSRETSYRAYNAYASFVLHLYEFLISLHARDLGVTEITAKRGQQKHKLLDSLVQATVTRVISNRISSIEGGYAPTWENHVSAYQRLLPVPSQFSENFRRMRNKIGGHVTYERIQKINLTMFYETNHAYLYLIYRDCGDWWANKSNEFPELEQITDFLGPIARSLHNSDAF